MDMDLPPHMWAYRLREGNEKSLLDCGAVWRCLACFCCEARCPRGVRPAHLAEEIRHTLLRAGSALSADDIPELVKNGMPQQLLVAALRKNR
jgi:heterodisulfide reductase subunit C